MYTTLMPMSKKSKSKKSTSDKTQKKSNSRLLHIILFAALLVLLSSVLMTYMHGKKVYTNLTYKEFPSSGIGIKAPKDWIEMQHFGSTMLHDTEFEGDDAIASIHLMSYSFLYTDLTNATQEERRKHLDKLAQELRSASTPSVTYSDIEVVKSGDLDVVMANSIESYSYLQSTKKAINVFLLTDSGEIKKVMITVNENIYHQNQKGMKEVAKSIKLL